MPKSGRDRKKRARARQARTGAPMSALASGTAHQHPRPDLAVLREVPNAAGRPVDIGLAAAVVAACRAGCRPCQVSLIPKVVADRPTVAALAGAVYGSPLMRMAGNPGVLASEPTRAWFETAQGAWHDENGTKAAQLGLGLLEMMTDTQVAELLDDALDHWAMGGIADRPDAAPHVRVITPEDLGLDPDGLEPDGGTYGVMLQRTVLPGHPPLPMLTLYPESMNAGLADLRRRTHWQPWDGARPPAVDTSWVLRLDIATRTMRELVRIDADGYDEEVLWRAAEHVRLPENWWDLIDRAQHMLVAGTGSAEDGSLDAGAIAALARVRFM